MTSASAFDYGSGRPARMRVAVAILALVLGGVAPATAAELGKVRGRVVASDTGQPIAFADVLLVPADTTMRRVGGLANDDGTFLLEAVPGRYTLQFRALSYARKSLEGVVIEAGGMVTLSTALAPDAIAQDEIVVEGRLRQDSESSLLAARRKATALGDAISAEQVRRSSDGDAAEVLRRVTGLSVSSGRFVFVRGLGERYSSTEVDGVRIASPEQNKRVVPLDMVPANLLENVVVQKTYTADRPGEFGGGDVQIRTRYFPGKRTWSITASQGVQAGSTFKDRLTYSGARADVFGFGAKARAIPGAVSDRELVIGSRFDPSQGFPKSTLAAMGTSFRNVWSPMKATTIPNAGYAASYGDEFKLLGRPVGLITSWSLSRGFDRQDEAQRFFADRTDTLYDYAVQRYTESVQLGGISALSLRLSPRHTLHVRGLYTHGADDEVRTYQGPDHNQTDARGNWLVHRGTRLMYVEREVLSGTTEGRHEIPHGLGATLDWKVTRSRARRLQPDRRETVYDWRPIGPDSLGQYVYEWDIGSVGRREYGELRDQGWGTTIGGSAPFRLGGLGSGKIAIGFDRQTKARDNFYRRLDFHYSDTAQVLSAPPESLFGGSGYHGGPSTGWVDDVGLDVRKMDNYTAHQRVNAGYLSVDLPLGPSLRGNLGVRVEHGYQDVRSFDLFDPATTTSSGQLDDIDWLPSGNFTLALAPAVNLRMAASRTLSRPDLNELSPSPALEYRGGLQVLGNPGLRRATLDNYDVRIEAFPALSEVFAAGFFYKRLHAPIEQVLQGGAPPALVPRNSDRGRNLGIELEARSSLGRLWSRLNRLSVNANASFISSSVRLEQASLLGSFEHPLQGQASYLLNAALSYVAESGVLDATVQVNVTGKRLQALGLYPLPDVYEQPTTGLDATVSFIPFAGGRMKLAARNLLDPRFQALQLGKEVSGYRRGRSYSIAVSSGS